MKYGDIIKVDNVLFKVVGGTIENNEECYECKPLVGNCLFLKDYVDNHYELVKENNIGVPIEFKSYDK